MAKQMYATVSDSRDEEEDEEGWLAKSSPPPQQLHLQKTYNRPDLAIVLYFSIIIMDDYGVPTSEYCIFKH